MAQHPHLDHGSCMPVDDAALSRAVEALLAGRLIGLPTETVYGLAGDAGNEQAVAAIYRAKGRPTDHPLIVHVSGPQAAVRWADVDDDARALMHAFWPGPLTLILVRRADAPPFACAGQRTVGLRCPSHPVAHRLLRAFEQAGGLGVAAPSANRFGRISPTSAADVRAELGDALAEVLEGGNAQIGLESTIVDLTGETPRVRRPGAITPEAIAAVLGRPVERAWLNQLAERSAPSVSGSLAAHYAPATPMRLLGAQALAEAVAGMPAHEIAVWSPTRPRCEGLCLWLPWPEDPVVFGRGLYASLRALDASGARLILVQEPPDEPAWEAVRDRLGRAAVGSQQA
ncbi:MAG: L-threonylcarbamoyladenylate synthase [Burkholderiaceae bacterium]